MADILTREGADVNAKDDFGKTALTYAIESDSLQIVKHLLYNGAFPHRDHNCNYMAMTSNPKIHNLIEKFRQVFRA